MPTLLFFLLKNVLPIQCFLWFHMNFSRAFFFNFCEKCYWKFDRDFIESVDDFKYYGHVSITDSSNLMNMRYLSIYLCILQFISSMFHTFQCTDDFCRTALPGKGFLVGRIFVCLCVHCCCYCFSFSAGIYLPILSLFPKLLLRNLLLAFKSSFFSSWYFKNYPFLFDFRQV